MHNITRINMRIFPLTAECVTECVAGCQCNSPSRPQGRISEGGCSLDYDSTFLNHQECILDERQT